MSPIHWKNSHVVRLVAVAVCVVSVSCSSGGADKTSTADRGEMMERLTASEVAAKRAVARVRADQYDLGLRTASINAPGQTPDEIARQQTAAGVLTREIKELRRKIKGYEREQKRLRARLGVQPNP